MSIGANGQSYEANYAVQQRLLAKVAECNEELKLAEVACETVRTELRQGGSSLPPEQIKALNDQLADRQAVAADASQRLADARTAVGILELAAGPEHAGWLEQRLPPEPPKDPGFYETVAEGARKGFDQLNSIAADAMESAKEFAEIGLIAGRLATAHPEPADLNLYHQPGIEMPRPPGLPEAPPDLDQKLAQLAPDPSREEERRRVADAERDRKTYEDALASAPSKGPPEPDPMDIKHEQERQALAERNAKEQKEFDKRHDRLNTDPMLIHGMQQRLNEQFEAERQAHAERHERERRERERSAGFNHER